MLYFYQAPSRGGKDIARCTCHLFVCPEPLPYPLPNLLNPHPIANEFAQWFCAA